MRYVVLVKATGCTEARVPHSREFRLAKEACLASMAEAGVLVAAEELLPSAGGLRLTYAAQEGETATASGPFPTEPWLLAEYFVMEAESLEAAARWARRIPAPPGCGTVELEVRGLEEKPVGRQGAALENDLADQLSMLRRTIR